MNTLHFVDEIEPLEAVGDVNTPLIESFYDALGSYIAPYAGRTVTVKWYDLLDPPPRVAYVKTFTIPAAFSNSSALPPEVAACLSYRAEPPNTARRRGRLYIGPLHEDVMTPGTLTTFPTLSTTFRTALTTAGTTLVTQSRVAAGAGGGWVVYSPTGGFTEQIEEFWVDNEADTMRSRGYQTNVRTYVPVP